MGSKLARWILFRLWNWKVEGALPNLPKYIIVVAPHTSWKDFPLAILFRAALELKAGYIGKDALFKGPFGWFFRATGGYPVDRSTRNNFVDSVVELFNSRETCVIGLAPEGTRKRVNQLRTGFYYMALGAKVPMVLVRLDATNKVVGIDTPFWPTGDFEEDLEHILRFFRGVEGFRPERGIFF